VENDIQLSILPGIDRQVQTCGGARFRDLLDFRRENLKIMGKTMLITLLLTTMAGLGAIKLRAVALENDPVKSFLSRFNGGSSMDHRGAPFEFMPPGETSGAPFFGTVPAGRWHHPWKAQMPPRPPGQTVDHAGVN
jgi:hypothetical protein